jgi:hypothetical protein
MKCFQSKCLEIVSDCSYSGRWVSDCREFLNEAGIEGCGHSAKEHKVLMKVKTCCRSHEVPHTLLNSARGWQNDKNTGVLYQRDGGYQVGRDQHLRYLDNTVVRCSNDLVITDPCIRNYNWHKRVYLVRKSIEGGGHAWDYLLVEDEDKFLEENYCIQRGTILRSGLGQDPPEEVQEEMRMNQQISND